MDDWKLVCVGRVLNVETVSTDKTGRGRRGLVNLRLQVESADAEWDAAEIGDFMRFTYRSGKRFPDCVGGPAEGDRVRIAAIANGIRPGQAQVESIERLSAAERRPEPTGVE